MKKVLLAAWIAVSLGAAAIGGLIVFVVVSLQCYAPPDSEDFAPASKGEILYDIVVSTAIYSVLVLLCAMIAFAANWCVCPLLFEAQHERRAKHEVARAVWLLSAVHSFLFLAGLLGAGLSYYIQRTR